MNGYQKTLKLRCPELRSSFSRLPDPRELQGRQYGMDEIMFGSLSLFLFKSGSRNQLNNTRSDGYFSVNYQQVFAMRSPHSDTVADVMCKLPSEQLEQIKMDMMSRMFEQKLLRGKQT